MREITVKLYQFDELSDDAKEKAREWWKRLEDQETYYIEEIADSLKKLFEKANMPLKDWSLGPYNQNNFVKFYMEENTKELQGKRALAWIENNLLYKLRISEKEYRNKRKDYFRYGDSYRIGKIKPVPLREFVMTTIF